MKILKRGLTIEQRFKIDIITGCWNWTRYKDIAGYGKLKIENKTVYAHRIMFEKHKGIIPTDKVLNHICNNRGCINPEHLEIVTQKENVRKGKRTKYVQ